MRTPRAHITTASIAVMMLGGLLCGEATAGEPRLSAQINGRAFKASARSAHAIYRGTAMELTATARKGRIRREVAITCPALDLASLPATLSPCDGTYRVWKLGPPVSVKVWGTSGGLEITVESFEGSRIQGTFSGTFGAPGSEAGPAVKHGRFDFTIDAG